MIVFVIRVTKLWVPDDEEPTTWSVMKATDAKEAAMRVYEELEDKQSLEEIKDEIIELEMLTFSRRGEGEAKVVIYKFADEYVMSIIEIRG